jgi:predicted RNA-binding Zn ribbon-like protein
MIEYAEYKPIKFKFVGGNLSLDFTNTVGGDRSLEHSEHLNDYHTLVDWSCQAGLLTGQQAASLLAIAENRLEQSSAVLERARALREAIYRIFYATIHEERPQPADLELLNKELSQAAPRLHLAEQDGEYSRVWEFEAGALDQMLGPVAQAAADLLLFGDLELVRQCSGDDCGWLFVDRTRNHSRRWCDMKDCGNLAKVKSFRSRKKEEAH